MITAPCRVTGSIVKPMDGKYQVSVAFKNKRSLSMVLAKDDVTIVPNRDSDHKGKSDKMIRPTFVTLDPDRVYSGKVLDNGQWKPVELTGDDIFDNALFRNKDYELQRSYERRKAEAEAAKVPTGVRTSYSKQRGEDYERG
jgi:hypothetical protein